MKTKSFAVAEVKSAETDDPNGAFEAILSAPTVDRDNEIVAKGAFGDLPARISIDVDHGLTLASTIGSGTPYYDGDLLKIKGTFSSIARAQEARALVNEGHITTMSVAFIPLEKVKGKAAGEPTTITKADLLNAAFVSVPANRDALVLSSKAGARNSKADAAHIQAIHDSAASLGADCSGMKAAHSEHDDEIATRSAEPDAAAEAADVPADAETRERLALRARAMQYPVAV